MLALVTSGGFCPDEKLLSVVPEPCEVLFYFKLLLVVLELCFFSTLSYS
jgi:hypothetical protein